MMVPMKLLLFASLVGFNSAALFDDCPAPGIVSRLEQSRGAVPEAPSPAPSIATACTSQTSNARGRYSTTLAPCTFTFHTIHEEDSRLIDFQTSDLCSDENGFLIMQEYVQDWADECVGDFSRCYSLQHHRRVFFDFLCVMNWDIPEETTHVSVNCMEDKLLVLGAEKHAHDAARQERKEVRWERVELKLVNFAVVMGSCLAGIFVISRWIVKPLVAHSSQQLVEPTGHDRSSFCGCSGSSCHCNISSSQWIPSQRTTLVLDESFSQAELMHQDFDDQIPADFDAVPIAVATIVSDTQ